MSLDTQCHHVVEGVVLLRSAGDVPGVVLCACVCVWVAWDRPGRVVRGSASGGALDLGLDEGAGRTTPLEICGRYAVRERGGANSNAAPRTGGVLWNLYELRGVNSDAYHPTRRPLS